MRTYITFTRTSRTGRHNPGFAGPRRVPTQKNGTRTGRNNRALGPSVSELSGSQVTDPEHIESCVHRGVRLVRVVLSRNRLERKNRRRFLQARARIFTCQRVMK